MQWTISGATSDKYRCLYEPAAGVGPEIGAESAMLVSETAVVAAGVV
jgi:hypothetical protein